MSASLEAALEALSEPVREIVTAAIRAGEARLELRDGVVWYCDPLFGPDVPLERLAYDETLGLVADQG